MAAEQVIVSRIKDDNILDAGSKEIPAITHQDKLASRCYKFC